MSTAYSASMLTRVAGGGGALPVAAAKAGVDVAGAGIDHAAGSASSIAGTDA